MDYSDKDISASGDELEDQRTAEEPFDDDNDTDDDEQGSDLDNGTPAAAAKVVTAANASAVQPSGDTAAAAQDALLSGELSTNAALLQLQVSELLTEVAYCRGPGRQQAVEAVVQQLSAVLADLPSRVLPGNADQGLAELISSWGVNPQDVLCSLSPPTSVQLVGSWPLGAAARLGAAAAAVVDVAVQMPSSCLHHKDILNYRYHAKRASYLSALAQHLASHTSSPFHTAQQQLAGLHGDPCKPVLLLHLKPQTLAALLPAAAAATAAAAAFGEQGLVIRLVPMIGLDAFEMSKLAPDRNNVRWITGSSSSKSVAAANGLPQRQQQQQDLLPTPHYNAGILHDMLLLLNQHRLQQFAAAAGPKFADTLLLLKVWAHRNGLSMHGSSSSSSGIGAIPADPLAAQADGFSGYLLALLLTAATQQVGLAAAAAMSPLQQLRSVLQLITNKQFWGPKGSGGIALPRDSSVPVELRLSQQQQQPLAAAAAAPVAGKVSKDQIKLQQKLQQQTAAIPATAAAPAAFKQAYDIVILDSTGHLNVAASLTKSNWQLAQLAAQQALNNMDRQGLDPDVVFNVTFGATQGLAGVFDYWWTVEVPAAAAGSSDGQQQQRQPGDQHPARLIEFQVEGLVRQALTSRAVLVIAIRRSAVYQPLLPQQQQHQQAESQPPKKKHKKGDGKPSVGANPNPSSSSSSSVFCGAAVVSQRITVGVIMNAAAALRVVDVGPAADDVAAAASFRALWGDKAELRRFQDGKISEAVVWEGVPPGERHRIPDMAVEYILLKHLPAGTIVQSCSTALDPLLYNNSSNNRSNISNKVLADVSITSVQPGSSSSSTAVQIGASSTAAAAAAETAASRSADAALDSLAKQLRGLTDVALKVIGVQPLSAVNRHTCCYYPKPHPLAEGGGDGVYAAGVKVPRVLETIDVMVQLEGSGRMPSDPVAFSKTKAALGVQLAAALTASCGAAVTATEEALEVLWQGYAFKLLLFMDRDNPMLVAAAAGTGPAAAHTPLPLVQSHHHGLISSLEAAHAAYGPTVRLAKRWLGLQLLLGPQQVTEEAVELIVGAVFAGPHTTQAPASRISGFLAFLHLVAHHPWSAAPLLIDPAGEVKQDSRRALQVEFEARRTAGTLPGMFLATPYDLHSSRWTAHHPSPSVTHHIASLARRAVQQLSSLLLSGPDAPIAQQQLHQLRKRSHTKKGPEATSEPQDRVQQEMTALAAAWRAASGPSLTGFDVWIVLRKEALPFGSRVDSLAARQLEALLLQQKQRRLQLLKAAGSSNSSKRSRKRHKLQNGDAGGDSSDEEVAAAAAEGPLAELLQGGGEVEAPKSSRAVLRSIPEQVLISKPVEKLRAELLVGFDPVNHYVQLCTERYGHLATFCADSVGGFAAVGVKWKAEAFVPAPLRPALAHGAMPISVTSSVAAAALGKAGKKGKAGSLAGLVVPNVAQILSELRHLGVGLVQEMVVMQ